MFKKLLVALLLVCVLMTSVMTVTAFANENENTAPVDSGVNPSPAALAGSGTEADPYLIADVDDLILFRDSVNEGETKYNADGVYVALAADIDLAGIDWSVNIGDDANATFDGIFDGKGHTIYNLTSTETAQKGDQYICTGLFGAIYDKAVIKNLTIENATINTGSYTGNIVGILAGFGWTPNGSHYLNLLISWSVALLI